MRRSDDKVLITGGAKGIGLALSKTIHSMGNDVTIVGRGKGAFDSASAALPAKRKDRTSHGVPPFACVRVPLRDA